MIGTIPSWSRTLPLPLFLLPPFISVVWNAWKDYYAQTRSHPVELHTHYVGQHLNRDTSFPVLPLVLSSEEAQAASGIRGWFESTVSPLSHAVILCTRYSFDSARIMFQVYNASLYPNEVSKRGEDFGYKTAPRAKIFDRDAPKVANMEDMKV